ncbi:MAG: helix-turn-helix transcriptional regulator [Acidimicrobiales bacterium]
MDGRYVCSEWLRRLRHDRGLTQRALADHAGVPQSSIAEKESCRREPSLGLLSRPDRRVSRVPR